MLRSAFAASVIGDTCISLVNSLAESSFEKSAVAVRLKDFNASSAAASNDPSDGVCAYHRAYLRCIKEEREKKNNDKLRKS